MSLALASPLRAETADARAELDEAAWAFALWAGAVGDAAALFEISGPEVKTIWEHDPSLPDAARNLFGTAEPGGVTLQLSGRGWRMRSGGAERLLTRNAAHEVAHVWQYSLGDADRAPRWLHEGFADALAREALGAEGAPAAPAARCRDVLRKRPVSLAQRAGDENAIYDCGSVIVSAVAAARGESVRDLYRAFAANGFSRAGLLTLADEASPKYGRSVTAFLRTDYSMADPAWVIEQLRAGRL